MFLQYKQMLQGNNKASEPSLQHGRDDKAVELHCNLHPIHSLGHNGDEPVEELGPVLGLDLDDVGVPAVEEVSGASVHHSLLEGLGRRGAVEEYLWR